MARRNNIYDRAIGGQGFGGPGRGKGFGVGGGFAGPSRDISQPDPIDVPYVPGGSEEYGATYQSPGTQTGFQGWLEYIYDNFGGAENWAENMGDIYDWWLNYGQYEENPGGIPTGGDSFMDWYQMVSDIMDENYSSGGGSGGTIGSSGDLGMGTMFSESDDPGIDCSFNGPQYDNNGNCYACCDMIPPNSNTGTVVSPCEDMYAQAGGYEGTQLSFSEFQGLYC